MLYGAYFVKYFCLPTSMKGLESLDDGVGGHINVHHDGAEKKRKLVLDMINALPSRRPSVCHSVAVCSVCVSSLVHPPQTCVQ